MGTARIQYELERTLPGLQLAAKHGLFDSGTELRAITQKRRQYEGALVRRQAIPNDYMRYVKFEEDLEQLRLMRLARLRDENEIPRHDVAKMHNEATHHIVSIFERGIQRCKYEYGLWRHYMEWAQRRRMRSASSRIAARALALFPNNQHLWLTVADYELNQNLSTTTARALLQRALRLNAIVHDAQATSQHEGAQSRPTKRARKSAGATVPPRKVEVRPAGNELDDAPTLNVSRRERELVRLWVEYIRMELVFFERLRRRRAVLNILGEETKLRDAHDVEEEQDVVPAHNADEPAPPSITKLAQNSAGADAAEANDLIVLGAIPAAAIQSAVSLASASSLPPRAHFGFLLAAAHLVRTFPFFGDAEVVRARLVKEVVHALEQRFPNNATALLYVCSTPLLDQAFVSELAKASELDLEQEKEEQSALKRASRLAKPEVAEMHWAYGADAHEDGVVELTALRCVLRHIDAGLRAPNKASEVALAIRSEVDRIRQRALSLGKPSSSHMAVQLDLLHVAKHVATDIKLGPEFATFLQACIKRTLQDAAWLQCQGMDVDWARLSAELNDVRMRSDGAKAKTPDLRGPLSRIRTQAFEATQRYPDGERMLQLVIDTLRMEDEYGLLERDEAEKWWNKIQCSPFGKSSLPFWQFWAEWIERDARFDALQLRKQFEDALSRSASVPEVHELLLQHVYQTSTRETKDVHSTEAIAHRSACIQHVRKHSFPRATFWRWVCAVERQRFAEFKGEGRGVEGATGKAHASTEDASRGYRTLIKRAFGFLFAEGLGLGSDFVKDARECLRFWCLESDAEDAVVQAMEELKRMMLLARDDDAIQVQLEREWRHIRHEMHANNGDDREEGPQAAPEEEEEDKSDGGEEEESDEGMTSAGDVGSDVGESEEEEEVV